MRWSVSDIDVIAVSARERQPANMCRVQTCLEIIHLTSSPEICRLQSDKHLRSLRPGLHAKWNISCKQNLRIFHM